MTVADQPVAPGRRARADEVSRALVRLPLRESDTLWLIYERQLSFAAVALSLGVTREEVQLAAGDGLRHLAQMLLAGASA